VPGAHQDSRSSGAERRIPTRELSVCAAALALPVTLSVLLPGTASGSAAVLVWTPALAPGFLLSQRGGWRGAMIALAGALGALMSWPLLAAALGRPSPPAPDVVAIAALLTLMILGIGVLAERLGRESQTPDEDAAGDDLVGLPGHEQAAAFLEAAWGRAVRGDDLATVLFEVDDLESLTASHGRAAGQRAVRVLAETLRDRTRQMDLSARLGPGRFVSVLVGCPIEGAVEFAELIRARLSEQRFAWGSPTVSVGVSAIDPRTGSADLLLAAADRALFRARESGGDRVYRADRDASELALERPVAPPRPPSTPGGGMAAAVGAQWAGPRAAGKIVVVDDNPVIVSTLQRLFTRAGYAEPLGLTDPTQLRACLERNTVDLLILDLHMPDLDGFQVLAQLASWIPPEEYLPVLVLTGDQDPSVRRRALAAGAKDFLAKPFDPAEAEARARTLLETRLLTRRVADQRDLLERRVTERTAELEETRSEILSRLALAGEYRDDVTGRHADRVGILAAELAAELGLDPTEVDLIRRTAPMHDIGKIGVPDAVLRKPGQLTPDEYALMQSHTSIGAQILGGSRHRILQVAAEIAGAHHELWDGRGYPRGLSGDAIPLAARIVAVADTFDTIAHSRPYKDALAPERAVQEILRCSGTHFDPRVVGAFEAVLARVGPDWLFAPVDPADASRDTMPDTMSGRPGG